MAASGDGAFSSSSPMDRLLRGISMPYEVPSVERRLLMNPPSPSRKKKEGFAGAALRMLGCASEAASQAYDPSVSNEKTPGRRRKTEKEGRRIHGGGKISCAPVTPSSTEASLAGRKLLDASEICYTSQIIMFQTIVQLGELDVYEQYQDQWLDVDNMSYEVHIDSLSPDHFNFHIIHWTPLPFPIKQELLELGDKIGQVNTGLEEEQIMSSLRKVKYSFLDALKRHIRSDNEPNCIICQLHLCDLQEEYAISDAIGELQCGHRYHVRCIKRWLLQKNACPVCKTAVSTQAFESG
ncbi:hypothetical protein ZIOFF_011348 [Zingiber officinale]|uniref:RING-type E3 ubiquitin transferase n=1 Tax=Zingiber officinale TaxID=94328 RepID=A0A8J5HKF5_ZINOF|nr:hypothetical protein ZIOFF_011348 [Zingiber officinale]